MDRRGSKAVFLQLIIAAVLSGEGGVVGVGAGERGGWVALLDHNLHNFHLAHNEKLLKEFHNVTHYALTYLSYYLPLLS